MNYNAIYSRLIRRAQIRRPLSRQHYEQHHVNPKCLGGNNAKTNLVLLTPEEHYVAHQLLVKMYPGNRKLLWAAFAMTGRGRGNGRGGNKLYGWLRLKFVAEQTGKPRWDAATKQRIGAHSRLRNQGENHPMFGRKHSEATKQKISAAVKGKRRGPRTFSPEHRRALSESRKRFFAEGGVAAFKGCSHSDETRAKMRAAKRRA